MRQIAAMVALSAGIALAQPAHGAEAGDARPVRLVHNGRAVAKLVVASDADEQTRAAAKLLQEYVQRATGADLGPVAPADKVAGDGVRVYVGVPASNASLRREVDRLDGDGYLIRPDGRGSLVIAGPTPWGTEFGVVEFLERQVGVRWLMPGPDGVDVPRRRHVDAPAKAIRHEPVFFSRQFSGLRSSAQWQWARRNRMHARVSFHHNLYRIIPPKKYATTHPEFFPIRKGKRFIPPAGETAHWQPCFSAEGLVEEAAKNICAYFDAHPKATSYSLGVNDSSGHCECEHCLAQDPKDRNFLGRRDVSDRYFAWCNKVVERVLAKHPGKYFGCLAYSEVAQAPSRVKVHPNIIPFMTYDRMKWIDPAIEAAGRQATLAWRAKCPTIGWYDYIYGSAYCVPRVYFHRMAESYRYAAKMGVKAMYAEAYPNFGEGPKLYVSLKLQWDPSQNVDALLRDWYVRAVGPAAADDLAAYYKHWEDFWTRRILKSDWWRARGQYLPFHRCDYLADVTEEEITEACRRMDAVVAKAQTPPQRARANLLRKAFEYYETSVIAYRGHVAQWDAPTTQEEGLRALDRATAIVAAAETRRRLAMKDFVRDPVLKHSLSFDRYPLLGGASWGAGALWRVFGLAREAGPVRTRLEALAKSHASAGVRDQAGVMLTLLDGKAKPISANPSFEAGKGAAATDWRMWVKGGVGRIARRTSGGHTGQAHMACRGMQRGGPHQVLPITPGRYAAVAFVRCAKPPAKNATVTVSIIPRNAANRNLSPSLATTLRPRAGGWTALAVAGEIPPKIRHESVVQVLFIVSVDGLAASDEIQIDDAALYRLRGR